MRKEHMEPTAEDWAAIGQDIRAATSKFAQLYNLPDPYADGVVFVIRKPFEEELDEWERFMPGSKQQLIDMATAEAEHRATLQKNRREQTIISAITLIILTLIIFYPIWRSLL